MAEADDRDEAELLAAVGRGDEAAVVAIYRRYLSERIVPIVDMTTIIFGRCNRSQWMLFGHPSLAAAVGQDSTGSQPDPGSLRFHEHPGLSWPSATPNDLAAIG